MVNDMGVTDGKYDYEPFGKKMVVLDNQNRLTFIGKENDFESNFGDFGVRKYDDETGRFISVDALWENDIAWTPYHYSYNNSIVLSDPSGLTVGILPEFMLMQETSFALKPLTNGFRIPLETTLRYIPATETSVIPYVNPTPQNIPVEKIEIVPSQSPSASTSQQLTRPLMPADATAVKPTYEMSQAQQHGGGKNAQHANKKAKDSAKEKYDDLKKKFDELDKKPNKTKEDSKELDKLRRQLKHFQSKKDKSGENHSQKAKGSR